MTNNFFPVSLCCINRNTDYGMSFYFNISSVFFSTPLPQKATQDPPRLSPPPRVWTTHSPPFTGDLPKRSHIFKSTFISLQAKWFVWIYSYFSLCVPSISYSLRFSTLVSLRCLFSIHPSLSHSDIIYALPPSLSAHHACSLPRAIQSIRLSESYHPIRAHSVDRGGPWGTG